MSTGHVKSSGMFTLASIVDRIATYSATRINYKLDNLNMIRKLVDDGYLYCHIWPMICFDGNVVYGRAVAGCDQAPRRPSFVELLRVGILAVKCSWEKMKINYIRKDSSYQTSDKMRLTGTCCTSIFRLERSSWKPSNTAGAATKLTSILWASNSFSQRAVRVSSNQSLTNSWEAFHKIIKKTLNRVIYRERKCS